MSLSIVPRSKWDALPPREALPLTLPVTQMKFVFTGCNPCRTGDECKREIQGLQQKSMDKGMPDLPYNFLAGGDKRVYEGRGWNTKVSNEKLIIGYLSPEYGDDDYIDVVIAVGYDIMREAIKLKYLPPM